jgi:type IV secretion system protein VirB9
MRRAFSFCLFFAFIAAGPALVAPPPVLGQAAAGGVAVSAAAAATTATTPAAATAAIAAIPAIAASQEVSAELATSSGGEAGSPGAAVATDAERAPAGGGSADLAAGAGTPAVTEKAPAGGSVPDGGSVPAPAAGTLSEGSSEPGSVAGPAPASSTDPAPPAATDPAPLSSAVPVPPAASSAAVPPAAVDGEALARAYRRTGTAATVEVGERGAVALVPFGHGRPVLRCAPLRACAVELEAGEIVLATSLGDGARWLIQAAAAGPGARTPLLVVKPTACDLSTNLVVATDRRIYELALDSPPCRNADSGESGAYNPHLPYTGLVRFYYPDEMVHRWAEQERLARQQAAEQAAGRTPLAPTARLARLNFDYAWDRGKRWPWVPAQVFDDGLHTYLVLGPAAHLAELPILLGVEPGGGLALLTYHLDGQTLIADRVLERAVLVVGHGRPKDEQRLEIANRAFGRRGGS